ncbi:MAG: zinc ribbon domain-containing protein [Sulfuricurvum sp.]|nr:zinc ribbon domain-containing protein [Sulfuricurvum sp.]
MAVGFWLAFLGMLFALIKYIYKKNVASKVEDLVPVVNAVINHGRDTISQIKPSIATYVEKHQTTNGRDTVSQIKPAINNYAEKHQTTKALFCIHCGNKCEADASFCGACGKAIEER